MIKILWMKLMGYLNRFGGEPFDTLRSNKIRIFIKNRFLRFNLFGS